MDEFKCFLRNNRTNSTTNKIKLGVPEKLLQAELNL